MARPQGGMGRGSLNWPLARGDRQAREWWTSISNVSSSMGISEGASIVVESSICEVIRDDRDTFECIYVMRL